MEQKQWNWTDGPGINLMVAVNWFSTQIPRQFNRERIPFQQKVLGQLEIHRRKMTFNSFLTSFTKMNSRVHRALKIRGKTKLLKQVNLHDLGLDNCVLQMTLKVQELKKKLINLTSSNKYLWASKYTIRIVKRQPKNERKICKSCIW